MAFGACRYVSISWSGIWSKRVMVSTRCPSVRAYHPTFSPIYHPDTRARPNNELRMSLSPEGRARCHASIAVAARWRGLIRFTRSVKRSGDEADEWSRRSLIRNEAAARTTSGSAS